MIAQAAQATEAVSDVDNTAAWLAFAGALLVASIAAVTAQLRQRVQLRHDRELQDLAELRTVLDEAITLTFVAVELLTDAHRAYLPWNAMPESEHFATRAVDTSTSAEEALGVVPEHVVHPDLLGGWWLSKPQSQGVPDEVAR